MASTSSSNYWHWSSNCVSCDTGSKYHEATALQIYCNNNISSSEWCNEKRKEWAIDFFIFWKTSKLFLFNTKILLVHMDEKWFYSVVLRKKSTFVPFLGMENHVSLVFNTKVIFIRKCTFAVKGIYLTTMTSLLVELLTKSAWNGLVECLKKKKDSYGRVYNDDNTAFTYPKLPQNIIRRKGEYYLKHWRSTQQQKEQRKVRSIPCCNFSK